MNTSYKIYKKKEKDPSATVTAEPVGAEGSKGFNYGGAKPTYTSPYSQQINALYKDIQNTPEFKYDPEQDESYLALKNRYASLGKQAMKDTTATVAAQTGGIASSYAASAGAQAYNSYMGKLGELVPELRQLAYEMYQDDLSKKYRQLDTLNTLENNAYGRYSDELERYYTDYANAYKAFIDEREQQNYLAEQEYKKAKDEQTQQNYLAEQEYKKQQDEIAEQHYRDDFAYKVYLEEMEKQRNADELAYQKYRDEVEDKRYDEKFEYQKYLDNYDAYIAQRDFDYAKYLDNLEYQKYLWEFEYQRYLDNLARTPNIPYGYDY